MPTMHSTALTFEPSSVPLAMRALASLGMGSPDVARNSPSSPRLSGSSGVGVASLRRPTACGACPPVRAVTVPSLPSETSAPGGMSMGAPPSDSTGRPVEVSNWPVADTSKEPARV